MNLILTHSSRHLTVFQHSMELDIFSPPLRVNDKYNVYVYPQYNMACCVVTSQHRELVHDIKQVYDIDKVILFNGYPDPSEQYPDDYHFVTNLDAFERCMGMELETEKRDKLRSRFFDPVPVTRLIIMRHVVSLPPRRARPRPWNKRLRQAEEGEDCCICMSKAATIMLAPCSHQCVCDECAPRFMQEKCECPLCREVVEDIWRPLKQ